MKNLLMPLAMGTLMGTIMGVMIAQGAMEQAGLGFVFLHVAALALVLALAAFLPRVRAWARAHFTRPMMTRMGVGMGLGVCLGYFGLSAVQGSAA